MRPVIAIAHAAFDKMRHLSLINLTSQLRLEAPGIPFVVAEDHERRGAGWCWRRALELGLAMGATHVITLPDDVEVCRDFGRIVQAVISVRPKDILEGFVNHGLLREQTVPTCWYSTSDGYTGVCGVLTAEDARAHFAWRDKRPELGDYPPDAGLNLWAIETGRLIYKTAWSLVSHNAALPSLCGNDAQASEGHERVGGHPIDGIRNGVMEDIGNMLGRTYLANPEHMPGRADGVVHLPPTYRSNMFDMVRLLPPERWDLDAMYRACHVPNETPEHVVIVVPVYREQEEIMRATRPSREAVQEDLEAHGITCTIWTPPGDSHVDRMRQRATHQALKMGATRLLWWDADIECLNPTTVRAMLATGHDVVAGACPFKDTTGRVVCNVRDEDQAKLRGEGELDLDRGCIEVAEAGTGFLMVSRRALLALFQEHHDLCHLSRGLGDAGEPLWAIWDANLVGAEMPTWAETLHSRTFLTEDFFFSRLWQASGGKVYVFVPATFRHWGLHGFDGSFEGQYGLRRAG